MKKKLLTACLTAALCMAMASCKSTEAIQPSEVETVTESQNNENTVNIQILSTSDMHGKFVPYDYAVNEESTSGSVAQIATAVKELRDDNTLVIDMGDIIQDNFSDLFLKDDIHPMMAAMNLIGYDVSVLGNHEFNYGMDTLTKVMSQNKAKILCSNVYDPEGKPYADPYVIIEKGGVRIGIIGMVSPNIVRWDSMNLKGWKVTDPAEETKKAISELAGKVDVLIAAVHMGENNEYGVANSGVTDLANACPELDVILAAHEHKLVEGTYINDIIVIENKSGAQTLSRVNLTMAKKSDGTYEMIDKTSNSIDVSQYEADPNAMAELAPFDEKAKTEANTVIGKLEGGNLVSENEIPGIPRAVIEDTAMIDLINRVQMYYADADISAAALFNSNSNLKTGDIKKSDVSMIYKYTNTLYKLKMTGIQLKQYMEWSASYYNTYKDGDLTVSFNPDIRMYNYDMFSGVNYEINIANEPGSRIENLTKKDGAPVADEDVFAVAVNNYRAGTNLLNYGSVFKEGEELPELLEIDVKGNIGGVRELIADYIIHTDDGILRPEVDNNWKITGTDWKAEYHKKAAQLIKSGEITLPVSEDGRTPNVKAITLDDINNR